MPSAGPTGAKPALFTGGRRRTVDQVRRLPYDDPGTPDLRSPARYLIWTGRQQLGLLGIGVVYGIVWMVAQALVPAAIGRGLQTGVAEGDLAKAGRWSLVVLALAVVQAVFGVLR